MTIAPACGFSTDQWNFLTENFTTYEPANGFSQSFINLIGKKVILLGGLSNDPIHTRAQMEFLKLNAIGRHCLLVEGLATTTQLKSEEIEQFKNLPSSLVIKGFNPKFLQRKDRYVPWMNLIHVRDKAYLKAVDNEKKSMESLVEWLKGQIQQGCISITHRGLYLNHDANEELLEQWHKIKDCFQNNAELNEAQNALDNFAEQNIFGKNLIVSTRLLLEAIKRAVGQFDKVFVLTSAAHLIGNLEFYEGFTKSNITVATLLPILPQYTLLYPIPTIFPCADSFVFLTLSRNTDTRIPIPRKYIAQLESVIPRELFIAEEVGPIKILTSTDFKNAARRNAPLTVEPRTLALIPITEYHAGSEFYRTLPTTTWENSNAFFAIFDHFLFASGIGIERITGQINGVKIQEHLLIREGGWYLGVKVNGPFNFVLRTDINWISSVFLFQELAKRNMSFQIQKDTRLNLTDIEKNDREYIREFPKVFLETLDNYAPPGFEVDIDGSYNLAILTELSISATTPVTISLRKIDEVVGEKRSNRVILQEAKKILGSNADDDDEVVAVQSQLTALKIE